jgi:hypothetical protein
MVSSLSGHRDRFASVLLRTRADSSIGFDHPSEEAAYDQRDPWGERPHAAIDQRHHESSERQRGERGHDRQPYAPQSQAPMAADSTKYIGDSSEQLYNFFTTKSQKTAQVQ